MLSSFHYLKRPSRHWTRPPFTNHTISSQLATSYLSRFTLIDTNIYIIGYTNTNTNIIADTNTNTSYSSLFTKKHQTQLGKLMKQSGCSNGSLPNSVSPPPTHFFTIIVFLKDTQDGLLSWCTHGLRDVSYFVIMKDKTLTRTIIARFLFSPLLQPR